MVKEASSITDREGGDGTTTTTVLLQAIVAELFEVLKDDGSLVKNKVDSIKLKKEVDHWCGQVVEKLKEHARPITKKDIYNVAMVSGEYEWLAKMVTDIYEKIGQDGYVTIEEGVKTEYEIYKGIELNASWHSDYYINNDKRECVIEKPRILVTNNKIDGNALQPIVNLIGELIATEVKELIIIAPEFSRDVLSRLTTTKTKGLFTAVALKLPTFDKDDLLVDVCTLTQAKFLDKNTYASGDAFFNDFKVVNLGTATRAVIGEAKTFIMGGEGNTKVRVKEIKTVLAKTESAFDRDALEKRIAFLGGGMAIIKIGGESEFERHYFKLKCEDSVNAVPAALKDGVVKGGGLALKEIADELPKNLLTRALSAPYEQIQKNSGGIVIKDSVVDPVKITIAALKSACSLAGMIITTEVVTAFKREKHAELKD